jgi:hypothetical protein
MNKMFSGAPTLILDSLKSLNARITPSDPQIVSFSVRLAKNLIS